MNMGKKEARKITKTIESIEIESSEDLENEENDVNDKELVYEYYLVAKNEYQQERSKKHSLENRAGVLFAFLGAIIAFVLDKVKLTDIFEICKEPISCSSVVQAISAFLFFVSILATFFFLWKVIDIVEVKSLNLNNVTNAMLKEKTSTGYYRFFKIYNAMYEDLNEKNNKKAKNLKYALISMMAMLLCLVIYINAKTQGGV